MSSNYTNETIYTNETHKESVARRLSVENASLNSELASARDQISALRKEVDTLRASIAGGQEDPKNLKSVLRDPSSPSARHMLYVRS